MNAIKQMIGESAKAMAGMTKLAPQIENAAKTVEKALKAGNKVLLAGNGGSATQAAHIAAEFTGRYKKDRKPLPGIALTADLAAITAIANDYGYERVFSRQLEALGDKGDVFIALSTSGNSKNLMSALEAARKKGIASISLLGRGGGKMKGMADLDIIIPSENIPRIQECHLTVLHIVCEAVEERMFP